MRLLLDADKQHIKCDASCFGVGFFFVGHPGVSLCVCIASVVSICPCSINTIAPLH